MKRKKGRHSFLSVLNVVTLVCWLMPVIIITTVAGFLLNNNYNQRLYTVAQSEFGNAMEQVEIRLHGVFEDCKAVSYDGVVQSAYRNYLDSASDTEVYREVTNYLAQKFSRNVNYRSVFISFLPDSLEVLPYACAPGISQMEQLRKFHDTVLPAALEVTEDQEAGIFFLSRDDQLYVVRNLLTGDFQPYAVLVMELEMAEVFQSFYNLSPNEVRKVTMDGVEIPLTFHQEQERDGTRTEEHVFTSDVDGHELVCTGRIFGLDIWTSLPVVRWIVVAVSCLVLPLLAVMILLSYNNVRRPVEILMDATSRIRGGQRGYQIKDTPPNNEFELLYQNFNDMSDRLESQFRQIYEEQQAVQQAKIKALQSQINPHFLNNTLEVLNWEARIAGNDRVCTMLESLSVMLGAAIGRDGRSQVQLAEELKYVDAYLHITQQRLGDRLTVRKEIAKDTLSCPVPLLVLQPILENAVEYDLSRTGGELCIRIYQKGRMLHLEVEHDGRLSSEDWEKIRDGLRADPMGLEKGRSVGIRNVANRLALIYRSEFHFDIREHVPGKILAEMIIPVEPSKGE